MKKPFPNDDELDAEEKSLLDRELEDYRKNPHAGSSWDDVKARLRNPQL
ncbi:MAG TPA: hypothetical protein VN873_16050 [Candidatus Angelobacter sp.]|nr:hypothetical protein [Candidatus Angelobacter sp.]